jgi:hypothetical protein
MATSSILGGERAATQADGRDARALGPSDSSDSGSDIQGELNLEAPGYGEDQFTDTAGPANLPLSSDSDTGGTGERGSAIPGEEPREGSDITPDRVTSLAGDDALDDPEGMVSLDDQAEQELADLAEEPSDEETDQRA